MVFKWHLNLIFYYYITNPNFFSSIFLLIFRFSPDSAVGACRRRRREPVVRGDLRYLRADQHVGGSGWVAVVSVDRGGHCGHFDTR
jgi:hypothetical protein